MAISAEEWFDAQSVRSTLAALVAGPGLPGPLVARILSKASTLAPQFERLSKDLPGLAQHLAQLLNAQTLLHSAPTELSFGNPDTHSRTPASLDYLFHKATADDNSLPTFRNDLIAVTVVCKYCAYLLPTLPPPHSAIALTLRKETRLQNIFFEVEGTGGPYESTQTNEALKGLGLGLSSIGIWEWARHTHHVLHAHKSLEISWPNFQEIADWLGSISETNPATPDTSIDTAGQRTVDLRERELSINHWHYFQPKELNALQQLADASRPSSDQNDPFQYERLIGLFALATGRTFIEALNFTMHGEEVSPRADDYQAVVLKYKIIKTGTNSAPGKRASWKIQYRGQSVTLPLPHQIEDSLRFLMQSKGPGRLIDLLPPSAVPWRTRVENYFEEHLGCSSSRLNQLFGGALWRQLYFQSGNKALISSLAPTSYSATQRRQHQVSLSYYLDLNGQRTFSTYKAACRALLRSFGSGNEIADEHPTLAGQFGVPTQSHRTISKVLRQMPDWNGNSQSLHHAHNSFAIYTLLLLIAATGHRKSTTPFHFPWDIDPATHLAFICDKALVGSEARFVPLSSMAIAQWSAYRNHLSALLKLKSTPASVKQHLQQLLKLSEVSPEDAVGSNATSPGTFFSFSADGAIKTISTRDVEHALSEIGHPLSIRKFRIAIANHLWETGLSAIDVSIFLGHSNDLHPFGTASNVSVLSWARRIRQTIEDYLWLAGWRLKRSPLPQCSKRTVFVYRPPTDQLSSASYEGRMQSRERAIEIAKQAVAAVIESHPVWKSSEKLESADRDHIQTLAEQRIKAFPMAVKAVPHALRYFEQRRRENVVDAYYINLFRFDPGPVEIQFARRIGIASDFRHQLIANIGKPISGQFDLVERIVQLTISLIAFDAVLKPGAAIEFALCVAYGEGITLYPDSITLRRNGENGQFFFEQMVLTTPITTAIILGITDKREAELRPSIKREQLQRQVEKRISTVVSRLIGRPKSTRSWSLMQLIDLFKAWWFPRMPGVLYSGACDAVVGPAPHPITERTLLAPTSNTPNILSLQSPKSRIDFGEATSELKQVYKGLWDIIKEAMGSTAQGTAHTRLQRSKLRKALVDNRSPQLELWCATRSIVDCLVGFASALLLEGGPRAAIYRASSINTYLIRVSKVLMEVGWDLDFDDIEKDVLKSFYAQVESRLRNKQQDWEFVVRMFHEHLMETRDAPYIRIGNPGPPPKQRIRTALISPDQFSAAWNSINDAPFLSPLLRAPARAFMTLAFSFGLRRVEALGITPTHLSSNPDLLFVRKNPIRDLKTIAARRVIPISIGDTTHLSHFRKFASRAELSPRDPQYLFEDADRDKKLISPGPLMHAVVRAMRLSAGNGDLVFHDLRRSFATRLVLDALLPGDFLAPTSRVRNRMHPTSSSGSSRELHANLRLPDGSPYLIDAIASTMGHSDVSTLLNVYFPLSAVCLAEITHSFSKEIVIDDLRLANMLKRDRTAITHLRSKLANDPCDEVSLTQIVNHRLAKVVASDKSSPLHSTSRKRPIKAKDNVSEQPNMAWSHASQLLCLRQLDGFSLDDLAQIGKSEFGIDPIAIQHFLSNYKSVVQDTGFDDFEPCVSELVGAAPKRSKGVQRGAQERESALARIQKRLPSHPSLLEQLKSLCTLWLSRIDPSNPMIVCRNLEEVNSALDVLLGIGAKSHQIHIQYTEVVPLHLKAAAKTRHEHTLASSHIRLSRGPQQVRMPEFGISIHQINRSNLTDMPDGRDFHRLMVILTCFALSPSPS